jgi:hypothetical protein
MHRLAAPDMFFGLWSVFAALHESAFDAVDGSFPGT